MNKQLRLEARVVQATDQTLVLDVAGQRLRWPASAVSDIQEGDTVTLRLLTRQQSEAEHYEQARALLSQILGGGT